MVRQAHHNSFFCRPELVEGCLAAREGFLINDFFRDDYLNAVHLFVILRFTILPPFADDGFTPLKSAFTSLCDR